MWRFLPVLLIGVLGQPLAAQGQPSPVPVTGSLELRADAGEEAGFHENRLDASVESALLYDLGNKNRTTVSPVILSLRWQLDDVGNDGWLRGNTEWVFSAYYTQVWEGVENRFSGALFGPRYNFVQPDSPWVPYIDSRVGFGFTDSQPVFGAQGQDFYFTFTVGVGVRYVLSRHLDLAGGMLYQHISNAGLSEPARQNWGLDTIGPHLSVQYRF